MSADLFLNRDEPLDWKAVSAALDALRAEHAELSSWTWPGATGCASVRFWNAPRASVVLRTPGPDDVAEDAPEEALLPYVEISARASGWPWTNWLAIHLAKKLGARVYDPQTDEVLASAAPAHDRAALLALHEEYLREELPVLRALFWAFCPTQDGTAEALAPYAHAVDEAAKATLGPANPPDRRVDPRELRRTYGSGGTAISVEVTTDLTPFNAATKRVFCVEGPPDAPQVAAFVEKLGTALGLSFSRVEEWKH